jgi:serine/threonine protein kinase
MIGHQLKLISLTPTFSCIGSACDGRDRKSLYLAFTATLVLQARILQDVEKLLDNPPSGPILCYDRCFPAISKLRKYPPSSDDYFNFDIHSLFPDKRPNRLLYFALTPGKELVIIKFAQQYSIELHDFCAKLGHAPQIFGFERLPGGWYAIAMEYIESGLPITHSPAAHRGRWTKELEDVVAKFHSEGLVHGDLRDANILCKGDLMTIIDFDWGGKDGEAFYPIANLNPELLEGRTSSSSRITKGDDTRVLRKTLAKLRDLPPYFISSTKPHRPHYIIIETGLPASVKW